MSDLKFKQNISSRDETEKTEANKSNLQLNRLKTLTQPMISGKEKLRRAFAVLTKSQVQKDGEDID